MIPDGREANSLIISVKCYLICIHTKTKQKQTLIIEQSNIFIEVQDLRYSFYRMQ